MNQKISVIIPIYNAERYLKSTLDSIRFQGYKNLEIVCVLDCPTDNSEAIINEIAKEDNRIKVIKHSQNSGPGEARNNGVKNATGAYIHFCDSDDLLSRDFYEILINAAVKNDADISACSVFNEKKPKESIWFQRDEIVFGRKKMRKTEVLDSAWSWRYLIRKEFWVSNNFSFPNLVVMGDTAVATPMVYYANKVALCSNAVYFYKNREDSILNKKGRNAEEQKIWKESVRNARKIKRDFIGKHNIKHESKIVKMCRKYLTLRKNSKYGICQNALIEYGKFEKKISVIIPIYNAEKYLKPTLDSIRFQSYKNLEIIYVLDCPTDNSTEIAKKFAKEDSRIRLVEHSQNMGLPAARNSGAENATGEYIHFMDSDDLLSPDFYKNMINAALATDSEVAVCSVFYEKKPKQSILFSENEIVFGTSKIEKTKIVFAGWAWRYLIKSSFWSEHNFSFPDLVPLEDMPVMIQMIYYTNKVALCSNAVYFYKNRESSILNQKKSCNPEKERLRKENFRKGERLFVNFIRANKIKRPNWFFRRYLSFRTKRPICINNPIEYEKLDKKISVIVPVYNVEKYLKETLNSIRFQTYQHLEIICALDCPTDNSAKIAEEIAKEDSRVKIISNSKNMGLPLTRNVGVENATGEYIHFCDADDLLSPDFYEYMIDASEKADADVSACSVFYEKKPFKSIWFRKSEVLSHTNDKIEKTEVAIQGWAWRYLIKKSFWNKHNFSFPDLVPMEDKPVMIPMIYYADKVALCPNAVYFYKNREGSILNKTYDPVREKKRSENRQKARKIFKDFMRANKIKRPSKLLYYIRKFWG